MSATVRMAPELAFSMLDDHRRLASHMQSPSLAIAGASMRLDLDARQGRGVGARIVLSGRVLGLRLAVEEEVVAYEPPRRKVWETLGEPRLLVISHYRMGYSVEPAVEGSTVCIWIDYELPARGVQRWLGALAGRFYARWCVQQMLQAVRDA